MYRITTAPTWEPLTVAEAKANLRVDTTDEDTFISGLISAAREYCESYTGRRMSQCTVQDRWDCWSEVEKLSLGPVQSLTNVKYYDQNGVEQTLSSGAYWADVHDMPAIIRYKPNASLPTLEDGRPAAVSATYVAGYASAELVPAGMKQAMHLLIAFWFENREAVGMTNVGAQEVNSAHAILNKYKIL